MVVQAAVRPSRTATGTDMTYINKPYASNATTAVPPTDAAKNKASDRLRTAVVMPTARRSGAWPNGIAVTDRQTSTTNAITAIGGHPRSGN